METVEAATGSGVWADPLKYRWLMFGVTGMIYFMAWLHRVAPTVVARDMALAFKADATELGLIASAYFYLYSAVQPPVGVLADTIGPRRVISLLTVAAAVGAVLFGAATDSVTATIGRALIGAGLGGVFVPALKIFSRWYRTTEFAGLTGLLITMGSIGSISAALPLTYLVLFSGWRNSFFIIGALTLVLAVLCWFIVRDGPEEKGWPPLAGQAAALEPAGSGSGAEVGVIRRLGLVFRNPNFWLATLAIFFSGGASLTFQGLWAVPFLIDVYGISRVKAGGLLMLIPLGLAFGAPVLGFLTDKLSLNRKTVILCSLGLSIAGWSVLILFGSRPPYVLIVPFFLLLGVMSGGSIALYMTIIKELFPSWLTGTAVGLMNPAPFLATALYQPFTGYLLDRVGPTEAGSYPAQAYQSVFIAFLISVILSIICTSILAPPKNPIRE